MEPILSELHKAIDRFPADVQERVPHGQASTDQLRETTAKIANEIREQITDAAATLGCDPLRVARNLVAMAPAETLCSLQTLLVFWELRNPFEPVSAHRDLIGAIPPFDRRRDPIHWFLLGGKAPALATSVAFFRGNLHLLLTFERNVLRGARESTTSDTARLIRTVFASKGGNLEEDQAREVFASEGFAKGLHPIDEIDFKKLPRRVRCWLLESPDFARLALSPEFDGKVRGNPSVFPDTPEWIAEQTWLKQTLPGALRNIRARDFQSAKVTELFLRDDFELHVEDVMSSITARLSRPWWLPPEQPLELPKTFESMRSQRLRNALLFFSREMGERLSVTETLDKSATRQLATDVSLTDWMLAVCKCESPETLSHIRPIILDDPELSAALFRGFPDLGPDTPCFSIFARDCLEAADGPGLRKLVSKRPAIFSRWTSGDLRRPEFREVIEKCAGNPSGFCLLATHAPEDLIGTLFTSDEPWMEKWRSDLAARAPRSRTPGFRSRILYLALRYRPRLIEEAFAWKVSRPAFEDLLRTLAVGENRRWHGQILNFVEADETPCWERCLRKGLLSQFIKRLIRREQPKLRKKVTEIEAEKLLRNRNFRKKLKNVIEGKAPARSLQVPRDALRTFIPWAKRTWRKKPTLAVAYELALAFSIRDAQYFAHLCSERWKSPDRDRGGCVFDHLYQIHSLPKKSGGKRIITVPDERLKNLQRRILRHGFDEVFVHPAAHGFKRGRSILTNAEAHVGRPCVVNVDIESFFPNTCYENIFGACAFLLNGELSQGARHVVADICSYSGGLPTGAPTSPAVANLVLRSADTSIAKAAVKNGITYTRYADDLTFSGESNVLQLLPFVEKVLSQLGYRLDPKKTNIFRRGRRQMVTGLVVNEKPNLPRRLRRRLRAAVHTQTMGGDPHWHGRTISLEQLMGRLAFLHLVQPEESQALKRKLRGMGGSEKGVNAV